MNITEQLCRDEGCKLIAYLDTRDNWTIGIGHLLGKEDSWRGLTITMEKAYEYLIADIRVALDGLYDKLPWVKQLDPARQGVLLNLAFNVGVAKLLKFEKTLDHIHKGEFDEAATEILKSVWSRQVGARATRLATQLRSGEWV